MAVSQVFQRNTGRTVLALFAILSILISTMAFVTVQSVQAITVPAVLALSEDCEQTALHKQIDWSGNDTDVIGDMHSNAGITVSGARNDVSGAVTFDDDDCDFVLSGSDNTGGILSPSNAASMADPAFAVPTAEQCTFTFAGAGDTDLATQDGTGGTQDVWLDDFTLEPGLYCKTGTGKLQQSKQGVSGTVSFFANGHIDLSNGSDAHYSPFRADQVLTHSLADSVDAVTLAGSGTDAGNHTFYNGIIYAPNGEAETGGQFITIGCIVAETVKLNGSDHIIGSNCGVADPDPVLELTKTNDTTGPVEPGTEVDFTITVSVTDGPAENSIIVDNLPVGYDDPTDISDSGVWNGTFRTITWGPLTVADGDTFTYSAAVSLTAEDGDELINVAVITSPGTNCPPEPLELELSGLPVDDPCEDDSTVVVVVPPPPPDPFIEIEKTNDTVAAVSPGDEVDFTITVSVTDGPAENSIIVDTLPDGYDDPTDISDGGVWNGTFRTITWGPLTVADGDTFTYTAAVSADVTDDTELVNVVVITSPGTNCPPDAQELLGGVLGGDDPCDDDSTVIVDIPPLEPTLVIDKVADTTTITISGPNNALVANPAVVTWTLTYTLTNGPVDNAVITDDIPVGFTFLDASDGGTEAGGTVTWDLGTITTSGSVSFRTTVDPTTIDRVNPTVNIAVIDSDDTPPDDGEDSVTVTVIPPVAGGGGNPPPTVPDTALVVGIGGESVSVPIELLAVLFLGSLGALALANVRTWSSRRR